jgi:DNA-binding winged helix-turn-helix (wHTH) protein
MRLRRKDENVRVTPKGLEILYLLVENRGRTVTREELLETVWKDTFIEEGNINFNISLLRKALKQNGSKDTQFIRTIPKEGYRFVADVREFFEEDAAGQTFETEILKEGSLESAVLKLKESPDLAASRIRWHFIGIVLLGVFLLSSFGLWWKLNTGATFAGPKTQIKSIAVLPLKSLNDETDDGRCRWVLPTRLSQV